MLVCGEFVCGEESSDVEVGVNSGAVEADEPKDLPEPGPQPAVVTTAQPMVATSKPILQPPPAVAEAADPATAAAIRANQVAAAHRPPVGAWSSPLCSCFTFPAIDVLGCLTPFWLLGQLLQKISGGRKARRCKKGRCECTVVLFGGGFLCCIGLARSAEGHYGRCPDPSSFSGCTPIWLAFMLAFVLWILMVLLTISVRRMVRARDAIEAQFQGEDCLYASCCNALTVSQMGRHEWGRSGYNPKSKTGA